ncbi:MAG: hypothetical protein DMD84_23340 [Candidatus Rokuibacteriota bacterium]|nr:MAG: hypothetical protein DMD84_23340 [Candidatus Rokubacteria bacterium]
MTAAVRAVAVGATLILLTGLPAQAAAQHRGGGHGFHGSGHSFHGGGRGFHASGHGFHASGHGFHGGGRGFHGGGRGFGHFQHRPFGPRLIVVAPFSPFGFYSMSPFAYSSPAVYDAPPPVAYAAPPPVYDPSSAYGPPPAYAAPPPAHAPPLSQDVQPIERDAVFPTGRYVLRGDGVNVPYTWVWIPNPPTAPPGGAPSSSMAGERTVYAWTDANGVTTWTDRLSKVPPEHRANARREP